MHVIALSFLLHLVFTDEGSATNDKKFVNVIDDWSGAILGKSFLSEILDKFLKKNNICNLQYVHQNIMSTLEVIPMI